MRHFRSLFVILILLSAGFAQAQNRFAENQIHLKTGSYNCPENVSEFISNPFELSELRNDSYLRILQFEGIPSSAIQEEMKTAGIELLEYWPSNAFKARIQKDAEIQNLAVWKVRSVVKIEPRFKLTKELANKDFPDHALRGDNSILLSIIYQKGISQSEAISALRSAGAQVIGTFPFRNQIEVEVSMNEWELLAVLPEVDFIEPIDPTPVPENDRARTNHRNNFYQNGSTQYGGYDGNGVTIAMGDDGIVGPHIDYAGRLDQRYAGGSTGDHGDHVAGIIMGSGNMDPNGRGNAPGAYLFAYNPFDNVDSSGSHYLTHQVRITSTSYGNGCNAGYTSYASFADELSYDNPGLLHVFSAGNSGSSNCGYGAGSGWGNITGGIKVGKNTIAVGNVSFSDGLAGSSSRGPADDGRIKPDVVAVGTAVYSTVDPNDYDFKTGTSMACPGVAGTLANMMQAYKDNNAGIEPTGALMKGILMNTADDLGNAGPDFVYGYGRVNARKAINAIQDAHYFEDSLAQGELDSFNISVPAGVGLLKVMVYWTDKEGSANAAIPLVNNLNMELVDPNGLAYNPWVLDDTPNATALNSPAVRSVDVMNNVEQVTLTNVSSGTYTVKINGANVPFGPQHYVIVYHYDIDDEIIVTYPNGGNALATGYQEQIRWDALSNGSSFTIDYSIDNGANWVTIGTAGAGVRYRSWTPPASLSSDELLVRVTRGAVSDVSDSTSSVFGTPSNFQVESICPDSIAFTWGSVNGATSYEILRMDSVYMRPKGLVTGTSGYILDHNPFEDAYYSIRVVGSNGGRGERSEALFVPAGLLNCNLDNDLSLEILSPIDGPNPSCSSSAGFDVTVRLTNFGINDIYGASFSYEYGATPVVNESTTDTIISGGFIEYTFNQAISSLSTNPDALTVYHSLTVDQNNYNDTVKTSPFAYTGTSSLSPWMDNLESFTPCATTVNCGLGVCALPGGWLNLANGAQDDIDWRTNFGGTASTGTGPSQDFNPGTGTGKYLYLEASSCFEQTAILFSPCVDIPATGSTELTYRYHMNGTDMGSLHTDIIANGRLYEDVIPVISGNQGTSWNLASVNLSPFAGQTVVIRLRGITGADFTSDIALDDFSIQAPSSAPVSDFMASANTVCQGQTVDFFNTSSGAPNTHLWGISPATGWSFVNSTNATSPNISVLFSANGVYSVGLKADNGVGTDSTAIGATINVGGVSLPFFEDFEMATSLDRFTITNPDSDYTWERLGASGNGGNNAAGINNFLYSAAQNNEVEDWLTTPVISLNGQSNVHLTFERAYARYSPTLDDSLAVWLSDDCGTSWTRILSLSGIGPNGLATAPDQTTSFTPSQSGDWCGTNPVCTDIDLSAYSSASNIQIRFVAKSGYGNNLYIDNINIGQPLPAASITAPITAGCIGEVFTFSDGSGGAFANYNWDFGSNANPATATGPGPHQVTYSASGNPSVVLNADNGGPTATATTNISINTVVSEFTTSSPSAGLINFNPTIQQSSVDSVAWDFGDGNTSNAFSPSHQYASNGTYTAELTAYNECGSDVFSLNVLVQGIGLDELDNESMKLFPQPTVQNSSIEYSGSELTGDVMIDVVDASGRLIRSFETNSEELSNGFELNLSGLAAGWYQVRLTNNSYYWQSPLIKQ